MVNNIIVREDLTGRFYDIAPEVTRLGPGRRLGIWMQGCPFSCAGCIVPVSQAMDGGREIAVSTVTDMLSAQAGLEGVSVSGGEPFAQPECLAVIVEDAKAKGMGSIVFSGYRIEALRKMARSNCYIARALASIDLLIDGVYVAVQRSRFGLRGSDNQKFHFLTLRYVDLANEILEFDRTRFEIVETAGGSMLVGIPAAEVEAVWLALAGSGKKGIAR